MGAPALVMAGLGLWGLDRGAMWRDEAVSFQVARRTVPQIWRLLHGVDAVHGLYYLLMHAVLTVHPGEVVLRLPSVCAAAVTAGLVAELGTRLVGPRVGLWAGLLYAVTPMAGHYAQEGRSYALVAAGATGATLLFVRAVRGGGGRLWWGYGAVLGLTCWLHEFAVLLLLAHAGSLALARVGARVWRGWGCAAGAVTAGLVPMVVVSWGQSAQVAWLRPPTWETAGALLRALLGPTDLVYGVCLSLAVLGAVGVVGRRGELSCAGVALPLVVVAPGVLMVASLFSPLYVDRYVLYALSGAPLLVAAGAERVARAVGRLRPGGRRVPTLPHSRLRSSGGTPIALRNACPHDGGGLEGRPARESDDGGGLGGWSAGESDDGLSGRCPAVRGSLLALVGVVLVGAGLVHQWPLLKEDRLPGGRADDLAGIARVAGREVRAGDAVLFVPGAGRNAALAYPGAFTGVRDVALARGAAVSGTLYGREVGTAVLLRRMRRLDRVWVVGDPKLLAGRYPAETAVERAEVTALGAHFVGVAQARSGEVTVRLYVRWDRAPASGSPVPPRPRPERW
ncbi:glycosyltransferase family 39 protein [Streptomyces sp. NPDC047028]|uniref:glycosyltransferase family 39 protein n=1 Tax=Streptomyces sp. NPDC047028 TaxID=3155793 RepID=UPI0033E593E5